MKVVVVVKGEEKMSVKINGKYFTNQLIIIIVIIIIIIIWNSFSTTNTTTISQSKNVV